MEHFAVIDVLIAAIVGRAADTLAVFTNRQWTMQPLVRIAAIGCSNTWPMGLPTSFQTNSNGECPTT